MTFKIDFYFDQNIPVPLRSGNWTSRPLTNSAPDKLGPWQSLPLQTRPLANSAPNQIDPYKCVNVCLFVLKLNVPVNNFSVISGRGVKCLAQGHNTAAVGLEPPTSRSGVRHSTTEPPCSPNVLMIYSIPSNVLMILQSFYEIKLRKENIL